MAADTPYREPLCQVCSQREAAGVAAMPGVPMSVAYCRPCLNENAHPLWAIHAVIEMNGGVEHVAEWVKDFRSYRDGRYIGWDEIVGCMEQP
jgi:hypothetical protein